MSPCCFISPKNGGRRGVSSDCRRNLQISRETSRLVERPFSSQMMTRYSIEELCGGTRPLRKALRDFVVSAELVILNLGSAQALLNFPLK
jgi:hypothetical protein